MSIYKKNGKVFKSSKEISKEFQEAYSKINKERKKRFQKEEFHVREKNSVMIFNPKIICSTVKICLTVFLKLQNFSMIGTGTWMKTSKPKS